MLENFLKDKQHDVDVINLKVTKNISMDNYDAVAVGGSFMMFRMNSYVRKFVQRNLDKLLKMKTGLFMCGADDKWEEEIKKGFPPQLLDSAAAKEYFGFEMLWDRMGPFFKSTMQKAFKTTEPVQKINEDNIKKFAQELTLP